jgi:hypothetical protein
LLVREELLVEQEIQELTELLELQMQAIPEQEDLLGQQVIREMLL